LFKLIAVAPKSSRNGSIKSEFLKVFVQTVLVGIEVQSAHATATSRSFTSLPHYPDLSSTFPSPHYSYSGPSTTLS
jgi:hypothetical protein